MALTKCPECGKEISTQAAACPSCGYPIGGSSSDNRIIRFSVEEYIFTSITTDLIKAVIKQMKLNDVVMLEVYKSIFLQARKQENTFWVQYFTYDSVNIIESKYEVVSKAVTIEDMNSMFIELYLNNQNWNQSTKWRKLADQDNNPKEHWERGWIDLKPDDQELLTSGPEYFHTSYYLDPFIARSRKREANYGKNLEVQPSKKSNNKNNDPNYRSIYATDLSDEDILIYTADKNKFATLTAGEQYDFIAEFERIERHNASAIARGEYPHQSLMNRARSVIYNEKPILKISPAPVKSSNNWWVVGVPIIGIIIVIALIKSGDAHSNNTSKGSNVSPGSVIEADSAKKREEETFNKLLPEEHLAELKNGITQNTAESIQSALRHLLAVPKDFPGRAKAQAQVDVSLRKQKEIARFESLKKAKLELEAEIQSRKSFARTMESIFLDQGMNVDVSTRGKAAEVLEIRWALASKVMAHDIQEGDLIPSARQRGFKKIHLSDGFGTGWSWTL